MQGKMECEMRNAQSETGHSRDSLCCELWPEQLGPARDIQHSNGMLSIDRLIPVLSIAINNTKTVYIHIFYNEEVSDIILDKRRLIYKFCTNEHVKVDLFI